MQNKFANTDQNFHINLPVEQHLRN